MTVPVESEAAFEEAVTNRRISHARHFGTADFGRYPAIVGFIERGPLLHPPRPLALIASAVGGRIEVSASTQPVGLVRPPL